MKIAPIKANYNPKFTAYVVNEDEESGRVRVDMSKQEYKDFRQNCTKGAKLLNYGIYTMAALSPVAVFIERGKCEDRIDEMYIKVIDAEDEAEALKRQLDIKSAECDSLNKVLIYNKNGDTKIYKVNR